MIIEANQNNELALYQYFIENCAAVPYCFPVSFECWRESMFRDCDYDGRPLFKQIKTFVLNHDDLIYGFIQFGLTSFCFDANGEKDYTKSYAVIRNLHYLPHVQNAQLLMNEAEQYFTSVGATKKYAFFHHFGMSCYARQGKLHASQFYTEKLLLANGYCIEHENVYYSKDLRNMEPLSFEIALHISDDRQTIDFYRETIQVGGCELNHAFSASICFLKWIYVDTKYAHQGLGTTCMYRLFHYLHQKGVVRLDTDTADSNLIAQGYYLKTGFADKGKMRSYHTV